MQHAVDGNSRHGNFVRWLVLTSQYVFEPRFDRRWCNRALIYSPEVIKSTSVVQAALTPWAMPQRHWIVDGYVVTLLPEKPGTLSNT